MNDLWTLVISALMLAAVMPVSVLILYLVFSRHTTLADDTPMHAAVLRVFDNADECAAFHADRKRAAEVRTARVMATYHRILTRELNLRADPETRDAFLAAMKPDAKPADAGAGARGDVTDASFVTTAMQPKPRADVRMTVWRRQPPADTAQSIG